MGSKQRQAQNGQKASFERNLKDRLTILSGRGIESSEVDKDNLVKKFRANIKAINNRLRAIDANEKKTEELARLKVEKAAAPKDPEVVKEKKVKTAVKAAPAAAKEKPKKKA